MSMSGRPLQRLAQTRCVLKGGRAGVKELRRKIKRELKGGVYWVHGKRETIAHYVKGMQPPTGLQKAQCGDKVALPPPPDARVCPTPPQGALSTSTLPPLGISSWYCWYACDGGWVAANNSSATATAPRVGSCACRRTA